MPGVRHPAGRLAHLLHAVLPRGLLDPLRGAIAQTVSGTLLFLGAFLSPIPLSSSQTSTAAILGAGSAQKFRTVYHSTLVRVLGTWLLTVPVCGVVSAVLFLAVSPLIPTPVG